MINFNARTWFFLGFWACFGMLAVGAYFQIVEEMEPCPLCISQRIAILLTGIVFLIAAIHNPLQKGIRIYAILGAICALAGSAISARHVWLQNLPPEEVPECSPGLEYIFENFPLAETVKLMLNGTGECADVLWSLFGLSIPGWTFIAFIGLAGLSLFQIINKKQYQIR
ncbi:MAG: disulfide bond formation protein B [Methyloprofundus sp.]|nr:disulfide bond formation protein B [Methyloprofundus sp.]